MGKGLRKAEKNAEVLWRHIDWVEKEAWRKYQAIRLSHGLKIPKLGSFELRPKGKREKMCFLSKDGVTYRQTGRGLVGGVVEKVDLDWAGLLKAAPVSFQLSALSQITCESPGTWSHKALSR